MSHEHRNAAKGTATLSPRQLPVYPSDYEGIPEADLDRLPLDWEQVLVPDPPDPARLQPFGELLGFGHVALHVARYRSPLLRHFDAGPSVEMPLGDLPSDLIPRRRDEATQLAYRSKRRSHEQEQVKVSRTSLLYAQPPEGSE
jgi:hypothetical protein